MFFYLGFVLGDSKQHFGNTVTYIVFNYVTYKQHREQHTYARIDKIQNTVCWGVEPSGKDISYKMNKLL